MSDTRMKLLLLQMLLILQSASLFSKEKMYSWDFYNCDLTDIIFAVSLDTGISISVDDTVFGKGSFRFVGNDFETAFQAFLETSRLYVSKKDKVWTVSKAHITENNGRFTVDIFDLSVNQIIEKISRTLTTVITYESLPSLKLTIHFKDMEEKEVLENLVKHLPGYELQLEGNNFHIGKKSGNFSGGGAGYVHIRNEKSGRIFVEARDCKANEVLYKLFDLKEGNNRRNYCFLTNLDIKISGCNYSADSFDKVLEKFCCQNGLAYIFSDEIYYIISDANSRQSLIEAKEWKKINLEHIPAEKFINLLNIRLGKIEAILTEDKYIFLGRFNKDESDLVEQLKKELDLEIPVYSIELKYLQPAEAVKNLSGNFDKTNIFYTDKASAIYFKGSKKDYERLVQNIEIIDKPAKRIIYDLLILQYEESEENNFSGNMNLSRLSAGDRNNFAVQLGNVMKFNLNVISVFGINFAGALETSIENNKTKVFADTTLCGISGKPISFQNTNTYRYRDNNLDPETGKPVYTGITREISSGLKLNVTGWVSGNGTITSVVTASVTRQGTDNSSSTGNPPPTSEKIVTTEVCGKAGEPVILSGLIENSETKAEIRTPLLSKIPYVGELFKNRGKISGNSQMVIYLVPHIDSVEESPEQDLSIDEIYKKHAENICSITFHGGCENE